MNENHLEALCMDWLAELGFQTLTGEAISPGGAEQARSRYSEVVLRPRLEAAITRLNRDRPAAARAAAVDRLADYANQSLIDGNRELYGWLRGGVPVEVTGSDGHRGIERLAVLDCDNPRANDLLAVQQLTVQGQQVRRPDVVLFVNGLPLVVIELKNPADEHADIEASCN